MKNRKFIAASFTFTGYIFAKRFWILSASVFLSLSVQAPIHAQRSDLRAKVAALRPPAEAWQQIEWRTDLQVARRQADAAKKPIFLWAMNGNPLGCT